MRAPELRELCGLALFRRLTPHTQYRTCCSNVRNALPPLTLTAFRFIEPTAYNNQRACL